MNTYKYLKHFRDNEPDGKTISELINEHKKDRAKRLDFYERYKASDVGTPILTRSAIEYDDFEMGGIKRLDDKVNNRLNNSFDYDIVGTKAGYMFGHPIGYEIEETSLGELSKLKKEVNDFRIRNNIDDKDAEWGKKAAICGYSARLAYIDKDGKERVTNIDPWEAIILSSSEYTEPEFAIRYFNIEENKMRVEFYDDAFYYVFETGANGLVMIDEPKEHTFDFCPLWGLPNNDELMADAERVFNLIDAYDRTLSDASNEIEQYRLAYLVLRGVGIDEESAERLKKSGILELMGEDDDVHYLTKDINDSLIEHHLDRLEKNIIRFSSSVNFTDESFAGISSSRALEFKLQSLENKCVVMERKMTAALRYQFKVICSAWAKKGICGEEDYLKLWFSFKRNVPVDILEKVNAAVNMSAITSLKTALSSLPIVDNVDYELEQRALERDGIQPLFGNNEGGDVNGSGEVQQET